MIGRAAAVWILLVVLLATLSSSGTAASPSSWAPWLSVAVAVVVGVGARSSIVLGAVRAGQTTVAPDGSRHTTPVLVGGAAAALAAGAGAAGLIDDDGLAIAVGGALGLVVAVAWPRPAQLRAWSTTTPRFLVSGAMVAALMAAILGAVVGVGRFGVQGQVPPGAFSQVLAGTLLCDALLGVGGFVRASTSLQRGLVVAPPVALPPAPGPVLIALLLAAPTVLFLPTILPPVAASTAVLAKAVVGALVGGGLHLAGGVRGARSVAGVTPPT